MITFFTDPHLGRSAASHTTPESRKKLDTALYETATYAANLYGDPTICCGDLFHKAHNNETVIAQGINVADECTVVMAGNHDLPNRTDTIPSMGIVACAMGRDGTLIASSDAGRVRVFTCNIDGATVTFIPHHSSQELFEEAIDSACAIGGDIVCLHANYESPHIGGVNTSINLTTELAERLLCEYDYIVMGHEHNHRWEMNGRLLVLGNTHPTSFHDISDKYAWRYDVTDKSWHKSELWNKEYHYAAVKVEDLLDGIENVDIPPIVQFIEVTGKVYSTVESHLLAQRMNELWRLYGDSLLMLRNNTEVVTATTEVRTASEVFNTDSLRNHLSDLVKDTPLEKPFKKYAGASYD